MTTIHAARGARIERSARGAHGMAIVAAVLVASPAGLAQSLFQQPVAAPPARGAGAGAGGHSTQAPQPQSQQATSEGEEQNAPGGAVIASSQPAVQTGPMSLESVSLMAVKPAKPREYAENDLITIIISERSQMNRKHETDSEKDYTNGFSVEEFMDLIQLLETRIQKTTPERLPGFSVAANRSFEGDAEYKREDRFTDRITARVMEVKPNGTLVLEARRTFVTDEEETMVLLSGVCRYEDVTDQNTVQSNQLFDLTLDVQNAGDLKNTNTKGLIPRVIEGLLNF